MDIDFQYAYLLLNVPFLVVWSLCFVLSKQTRSKQVVMSLVLSPLGMLMEILYFQDYWKPGSVFSTSIGPVKVLFEDFLFSFYVAGLASIAYDIIPSKKNAGSRIVLGNPNFFAVWIIVAVVSVLLFKLGINSIFATSAGFLSGATLIIIRNKNLFPNAFSGGIFIMLIMLICYLGLLEFIKNSEEILKEGWYLHNTKFDVRFQGIPLTEMVWGFSYGFVVGPM